jgi:hypothetical protein
MWIDIIGWENIYAINEYGEVINKLNGNLLIGDINSAGYARICLYCKNHTPQKQRFFRHRLVAMHFIPNPYNLPEVNHKDLNKLNNYYTNLEWCDRKYNELYSRINGDSIKEYKPFFVIYINGIIERFDTGTQLAEKLKITRRTVYNWLFGISKGYLNYNIAFIKYIGI